MAGADLTLARSTLQANRVTRHALPGTVEQLLAAGTVRRHADGTCLTVRDDPVDSLQLVLAGSLEASVEGAEGQRAICWYVGPGHWFNMIPILDGGRAIHTARAQGPTTLLHLPGPTFLALLAGDPGLARGCLLMLCDRARTTYDNLAAESLMPLHGRLARHLALLLDQHGQPTEQGVELALHVPQEALADMLATTRQRLNRELKAMEAEGILRLAYRRIVVLDTEALKRRAIATLLPG